MAKEIAEMNKEEFIKEATKYKEELDSTDAQMREKLQTKFRDETLEDVEEFRQKYHDLTTKEIFYLLRAKELNVDLTKCGWKAEDLTCLTD